MAEWVYFIRPHRDDFLATMTAEEQEIFRVHYIRLRDLVGQGVVVLAGPTTGRVNTGIVVFEAPDEETARQVMEGDPVIAAGIADGDLQPFEVSLLRGRARGGRPEADGPRRTA
jgi:uncharacterized protein YciI